MRADETAESCRAKCRRTKIKINDPVGPVGRVEIKKTEMLFKQTLSERSEALRHVALGADNVVSLYLWDINPAT